MADRERTDTVRVIRAGDRSAYPFYFRPLEFHQKTEANNRHRPAPRGRGVGSKTQHAVAITGLQLLHLVSAGQGGAVAGNYTKRKGRFQGGPSVHARTLVLRKHDISLFVFPPRYRQSAREKQRPLLNTATAAGSVPGWRYNVLAMTLVSSV